MACGIEMAARTCQPSRYLINPSLHRATACATACHDIAMTASDPASVRVIIHLMQQSTVSFDAGDMWPPAGAEFDVESFAAEVTRRLYTDGYIGYRTSADAITVIPANSVK